MGHGWYVWLDRFAKRRFRIGSPGFIATKVALDEGVFGPIHVLGFFAYMTLVEGGSWQVSNTVVPGQAMRWRAHSMHVGIPRSV